MVQKRAGSTGRVTPKKQPTPPAGVRSGRYTPPTPKSYKESPRWVPITMGVLLVAGMLVIVFNYMGLVPGDTSNGYLALGLLLITGGFVVATKWR